MQLFWLYIVPQNNLWFEEFFLHNFCYVVIRFHLGNLHLTTTRNEEHGKLLNSHLCLHLSMLKGDIDICITPKLFVSTIDVFSKMNVYTITRVAQISCHAISSHVLIGHKTPLIQYIGYKCDLIYKSNWDCLKRSSICMAVIYLKATL